jgi:tellurium resistance protein TerD
MTNNYISSPVSDALSLGIGLSMSNQLINNMNTQTPPPITEEKYYVYLNNQKEGPLTLNQVSELLKLKKINNDTLVWKTGLIEWVKLSNLTEFKNISIQEIPNLPPNLPPTPPTPLLSSIEEKKYFVYIDNDKKGPLSKSEIIDLANNKKINKSTFIWFYGLSEWKSINDIDELKNIVKDEIPNLPPVYTKISKKIIKGQKLFLDIELGTNKFMFGVNWSNNKSINCDIDMSILMLGEDKKLQKEEDFIFYNNKENKNKSIMLIDNLDLPYKKLAQIDLDNLTGSIYSLIFVLTIFEGLKNNQTFEDIKNLYFDIFSNQNELKYDVEDLKEETAIILAEIYKRDNKWKIQAIGEGYKAGLDSIIKQYARDNINL